MGIQIIPASSPQAKGRIERNHGTQQDRLVKKLRRQGIADLATANTFLETYWTDHNTRFARAARSADDFHVTPSRGLHLDTVFRLHEERVVSNDWVVRYANRHFQLERQSGQAPARSTVVVAEDVAGDIEIRYRNQRMRWTEIIAGAVPSVSPRVGAPAMAVASLTAPHRTRVAAANHPWRHMRVRPNWQVPVP